MPGVSEQAGGPACLHVLDLGTHIAAPFAATILGDLGAEVIRCEQPGTDIEGATAVPDARRLVEGRNKRSITIDLRAARGQDLLRGLVLWADVLIESFRPGTMRRWGLEYDRLASLNSRLVYVSVSGFGQSGPYASRSGYDSVGAAFGGLTAVTGYPDRPPVLSGLHVVDHLTGVLAALGALEAVRRRDAVGGTGRGSHVDAALYESALRLAGVDLAEYSMSGSSPQRAGGMPVVEGAAEHCISYVYRTRDGHWLSIFYRNRAQLDQLRSLIGDRALDDSKFETAAGRVDHSAEFYRIVSAWVAQQDLDEVWPRLQATEIPASPVNEVSDLIDDPHVIARDMVLTLDVDGRSITMPGVVPRIEPQRGGVRWAGEEPGISTERVLTEILHLSMDELAELRDTGVI
jgi:crotonobetainyl-CoA:carnitine CoA-transferase CaiB-like acyl-CoA transferase